MSNATKTNKRGKTFEERFLDELARQCAGEDTAIPNRTLREQLGWQDERFDKVRAELIKKNLIKAERGQGGKTRFLNHKPLAPKKKSLKAFISYSHADEKLKDRFLQHLKPLERLGLISSWQDRMLRPGDSFNEVIAKELNEADLIFFLISIDFINSKYCYEIELSRAMERHGEGSARIIPVILKNCLWKHSPFGGIQGLPQDAKPVTTFADHDEAFTSIAEAVHELAVAVMQADEK